MRLGDCLYKAQQPHQQPQQQRQLAAVMARAPWTAVLRFEKLANGGMSNAWHEAVAKSLLHKDTRFQIRKLAPPSVKYREPKEVPLNKKRSKSCTLKQN